VGGGGGSARTILEIVQRQEAQQGDKAAAAGDKAMTMNHNGDDGKHSTVMFRNIFQIFKNQTCAEGRCR
jgi:hypothetical protein